MIESTLGQAAEFMHGKLVGEDAKFRGVSTDTRTLSAGQLFVALTGPHFDGRDFIGVAAERKAAGTVVAGACDSVLPSIAVDDTRLALGRLSGEWRDRQQATVVGITGSNGKTTLKQLIASCLGRADTTLATRGNLNNDIGLPLTLLRLGAEHKFAVIEMGANHIGEIAYLTALARPDVVVITNAGPAHLEGFGSIEGVARGKGEILQGDRRPAHAVLNADDRYFNYWLELCADVPVTSFGLDHSADVYATGVKPETAGTSFKLHFGGQSMNVALPLPGEHNVRNACAAAAVCLSMGIDAKLIRDGLESVEAASGRLTRLEAVGGALLFDDSYNANPASVDAAADFIAAGDGESILVLGDMRELGSNAVELHRQAGRHAKEAGVSQLVGTGELTRHAVEGFGEGAHWLPNVEAIVEFLRPRLKKGQRLLVKGSRSMHMGRVVRALQSDSATNAGTG